MESHFRVITILGLLKSLMFFEMEESETKKRFGSFLLEVQKIMLSKNINKPKKQQHYEKKLTKNIRPTNI